MMHTTPARRFTRFVCFGGLVLSVVVIGLLVLQQHTRAEPSATLPATLPAAIRVVLVGDGTSTQSAGWGAAFGRLLADHVEFQNLSKPGRSSSAFIAEGRFTKALDERPDFVLIQFGHNDEQSRGTSRPVDPGTTYKQNLARFVDQTRAVKAAPLLVTPMARRQFGPDGKIHSALQPYADAAKSTAAEKSVPLLDLHARSIELYEKLGPDGCRDLSAKKADGSFDPVHLSHEGACAVARLISEELKKASPALTAHLR